MPMEIPKFVKITTMKVDQIMIDINPSPYAMDGMDGIMKMQCFGVVCRWNISID